LLAADTFALPLCIFGMPNKVVTLRLAKENQVMH
jgi:hypothetical protein